MRTSPVSGIVAVFLLIGSGAAGAASAERTQTVVIRVDTLTSVPRRDLARAMEEAGRLFRLIDVRIAWTEMTPNAVNPPSDLVVALLARDQLPARFCSSSALGVASHTPHDRGHAYIFFDQVTRLVRGRADPGLLLGFVMAHEVGHLLLPAGSHSDTGIMRAHWVMNDLRTDTAFLLQFSDREAALIHESVAALLQARTHLVN